MSVCSHCGREVRKTVHKREGNSVFKVDYYTLLTGVLSKTIIQDPSDETDKLEFYKLTNPRWVITCKDCYEKPEIRSELERLFSGTPEEQG